MDPGPSRTFFEGGSYRRNTTFFFLIAHPELMSRIINYGRFGKTPVKTVPRTTTYVVQLVILLQQQLLQQQNC